MSKRIYVGNLSFTTSDDGLRDAFSKFGTVTAVTVVSDRETGRSRGFGFVEMSAVSEAEEAIEAMNGQDLEGRTLKVNQAKPREDRGTGGGRH